MVLDLKKVDFSPIHEDVNILIDQECLNEVRSLIRIFACEAEFDEESVLTMNRLSLHVKESVQRFILRNEVGIVFTRKSYATITVYHVGFFSLSLSAIDYSSNLTQIPQVV